MLCRKHENLLPVHVHVAPIGEGPLAASVVGLRDRYSAWLRSRADGRSNEVDDPLPIGQIVRFYDEGGPTLDLRTEMSLTTYPTVDAWKQLVLAGLPLPVDLEV